jgi:predicted nuclease of predicted toxin-antitoxin system
MKLLFDQNLSPHLVSRLADLHAEATHVSFIGLDRASDEAVWTYARTNSYAIVTKDADFGDLGLVRGFPPRVIWLRLGNCTTAQIEALLRESHEAIEALDDDSAPGILMLY